MGLHGAAPCPVATLSCCHARAIGNPLVKIRREREFHESGLLDIMMEEAAARCPLPAAAAGTWASRADTVSP